MLLELVALITALNLIFTLWSVRVIILEVKASVTSLDQLLGTAISNLIEKGVGDIEPINPIQQAIAQMLTNNLQRSPPGEVINIETARDDKGRFA
jgi:hypothetical protein